MSAAEKFEAILAMTLEIEDEQLKPVSCRLIEADRVNRLQDLAESLTPQNAVAVLCTTPSGETIETVVNSATMEHCLFEDPIMCSELSIGELVEAQFEADGPWTLCVGTVGMVNDEKRTQFKRYDEMIKKDNPDCLMTLRCLLRSRPITTVYSGGGSPPHVPSHCGFTLRMPRDEIVESLLNATPPQWMGCEFARCCSRLAGCEREGPAARYSQVDLQHLHTPALWHGLLSLLFNPPSANRVSTRPAIALRKWQALTSQYTHIDPTMDGAPATEDAVRVYFSEVVRKLKASEWLGSELLDNLVSSEKYGWDPATEMPCGFEGSFKNEWTDLVLATTI